MQRFITRKTVKIKRYQILIFGIFIIIFFVCFLNFIAIFLIDSFSEDKMLKVLIKNSYGNILNDSNNLQSNYYLFKNAFGFPFASSKKVIEEKYNIKELIDKPIIYIYNTFQTDKYQNNYYSSYSINPVVVQADFIFQEYLKSYGYSSLVEEKSVVKVLKENSLPYSLSYRGSRILMEDAKKENNTLEYYFDLGISDDKKEVTTFSYSDNSYARILFIVGTEYVTSNENKEFATTWNQKLEAILPGISRGVSLRGGAGYHGIYNQDFSDKALLIYVGGKENTIDEVNRSLKILAEAFNDLMGGTNE